MNARYSNTLQYAFVVGDVEFQKLVGLLHDRIGKVEIRANCVDDINREFGTVNDLIAYENPKSKAIRCVYLTTTSDDYSKSAVIALSDSLGYGVLIEISGNEEFVIILRERILDIIAGMRPSYDGMCRVNFSYLFIPILVMMFFQLFVAIELKPELDSTKEKIFIGMAPTLVNIVLLPLFIFGNKLRGSIFPQAVFMIGQGKRQFKIRKRIRGGVIAFFVSLATGLIIWLITG